MRRIAVLSVLLSFIFLPSCLPKVKLDYQEEKKVGSLQIIYEEAYYSYAYRIVGKSHDGIASQNKSNIFTELCEIHGGKVDVMFTLKGEQIISLVNTYDRAGDYLYFQSNTGEWEHSLLVYNRSTGLTKRLIEYPSSNMVVPPASSDYGYTLRGSVIVAIDLDTGLIDEKESWPMENSTSFFYSESDEFYKKASRISMLDDRTIQIQIGAYYYENSSVPEESTYYQFDFFGKTIWGPY